MDKKKNLTIKAIYATSFDIKTFTWKVKKLTVAKECSKYVALTDGSRIDTCSIYGVYTDRYMPNERYSLVRGEILYSLKPFGDDLKKEVRECAFEESKDALKKLKDELVRTKERVAKLYTEISDQEKVVKEISTLMGV